MSAKVYIIIVTYNGEKWLQNCLDSCKNYNVIVIDNKSTDNTINIIKDNFPKVKVFKQTKNLGFGQANNKGIAHAINEGADYVFLLNQDAYLQSETIKKMIEVHTENPDFGILSPIHLNGEGSKLDRLFSLYISYDKNQFFYFDAIKNNLRAVYEVPFVNAAAWLLPISTIKTIGGFDPMFFHYGEDENYCQRAIYHGLKVGVVSGVKISHDRETRNVNHNPTLEKKLLKKETILKIKWGNINFKNREENIKKSRNILYKSMFKHLLRLDFYAFNMSREENKMIKRIMPQILRSISINKNKGKHYVNI